MSSSILKSRHKVVVPTRPLRSLADALVPLEQLAKTSESLLAQPLGGFTVDGQTYTVPRYVFIGPKGGGDPIRLGLFGGIHGDVAAGVHALSGLLAWLHINPELATDYYLFVYPLCNPTGYEDRSQHSRSGKDLDRESWSESKEPELQLLQAELSRQPFHGLVELHAQKNSPEFLGYTSSSTLAQHVLEPAISAAGHVLGQQSHRPANSKLSAGKIVNRTKPYWRLARTKSPAPFEIRLEVPYLVEPQLQQEAFTVGLLTFLAEYKIFMAFAPNL
ncbi:MAG: hypothetical protein WCO56_24955 [Verrucomicrobiota bacterium]